MKVLVKNKKVLLSLTLFSIFLIVSALSYEFFFKNMNENEYCKIVREKKSISSDYKCKVGEEIIQNGKRFIEVSMRRPNEFIVDLGIFTVDTQTKEVTSEAWAN